MYLPTIISLIALISPAEDAGEGFGQLLFPILLVVVIYLIVRKIRKKK